MPPPSYRLVGDSSYPLAPPLDCNLVYTFSLTQPSASRYASPTIMALELIEYAVNKIVRRKERCYEYCQTVVVLCALPSLLYAPFPKGRHLGPPPCLRCGPPQWLQYQELPLDHFDPGGLAVVTHDHVVLRSGRCGVALACCWCLYYGIHTSWYLLGESESFLLESMTQRRTRWRRRCGDVPHCRGASHTFVSTGSSHTCLQTSTHVVPVPIGARAPRTRRETSGGQRS